MKISKTSISARLYKQFYDREELPDNLCPYFWSLVIAFALSIPYFLIIYPAKKNHTVKSVFAWILYIILGAFVFGIICWFVYIEYNLVKAMFRCYSYNQKAANIAIGLDSWLIFCLSLNFIFDYIKDKRSPEKKEPKAKKEYIVTEFIKGKYHRYCPHIEWKD